MIGRKVSSAWHRLESGTVVQWEPLSSGMTDVLVRESSGRESWYASSDLQPADGLGPLPSRQAAREIARVEALAACEKILAAHVRDFNEPWPGAEHGKAIIGNAIVGAIKELKR